MFTVSALMEFDPKFGWTEILIFCGLLMAVAAIWRNFQDKRDSRAQLIVAIANNYINDPEILKILYDIEYDKFRYTRSFHESENEIALDKLLGHFDLVCALYLKGSIKSPDLDLVKYDLRLVYANSEIQLYFSFLDKFQPETMRGGGFESFKRVGAQLAKKYKPSSGETQASYEQKLNAFFDERGFPHGSRSET